MRMRKLFLGLLVLASGLFNVQKAAAWAVTDTVVADGYYYICSNYITDGKDGNALAGKGNIVTASPGGEYAHMTVLYIQPFSKLASEWQSNLNSIFRITRDADGMYHIKSMREGKDTYFYPNQVIGGNTGYLWGTGRDNDRYYFRTMDWGGSKNAEGYQYILNRKDSQQFPRGEDITRGIENGNDTSLLVPATKTFFIRPESSISRWRIGGSELVKLNSQAGNQVGACWYLEEVKLTEDEKAWMDLHGAVTDAMGNYYTAGSDPGMLSSKEMLDKYNKIIDDASEMLEFGGTIDELKAMQAKVEGVIAEAAKYVNPLNGYYYMRNHYNAYGQGTSKYAVAFNEFAPREYLNGSNTLYGATPDDSMNAYSRSHRWFGETFWFGYEIVKDADYSAATAEDSKLLDNFIWKITPRGDGYYDIKNCAESSWIGDSTYIFPYQKRLTYGYNGWCQFVMTGTPRQGWTLYNEYGNSYRLFPSTNGYPVNMGVQHFCTENVMNTMTYALWDLFKVADERLTPKFKLNCAITDAGGILQEYRIGDNPGFLKESYVAELKAELEKARAIYASGNGDMEAAAKDLDAIYQKTLAVLKDTDKVLNPIEEGYYRFLNADTVTLYYNETHQYKSLKLSSGTRDRWLPRDGKVYYPENPNNKFCGKMLAWEPKYHLYAQEDGKLMWTIMEKYICNEDTTALVPNPKYIDYDMFNTWHLTKAGKNAQGKQLWYAQNLGTGKYLDLDNNGNLELNEDPVAVLLDNNCQEHAHVGNYLYNTNYGVTKGWYMITDPDQKRYLHCNGNPYWKYDTQKSNRTNTADAKTLGASGSAELYAWAWIPAPITGRVLDSLLAPALAKQRVLQMHDAIADAQKALAKTIVTTLGDSLITETGWVEEGDTAYFDQSKTQIWMNQLQTTEKITVTTREQGENKNESYYMTNYKYLLDGNLWTYVHSRFNTGGGNINDCKDYNALLVDLKEPQDKIAFKYGQRGNASEKYGPLGKAPITYGVNDYGVLYRPTYFIVYGANEEDINGKDTTWTEVAQIKDIPVVKDQRIYTSPLIESATPFRFYKFSVTKTAGTSQLNGHPHISPSYFQVFKASVDEANSPVNYDPAVKAAAEKVQAALKLGEAAYAAGEVSQELIDNLKAAVDGLNEVAPDTMNLFARIMDAKVLRDSTYTENNLDLQEYGDVTTGQKAAFEAAIAKAQLATDMTKRPTSATLKAAYDELNSAYFTFNAEKKTFEPGKWYYILTTEKEGFENNSNWAWRGNQMVYACGDIPQAPLTDRKMGNIASRVRWGHYTNFNGMQEGQEYPKNLGATVDYTGGNWGAQVNNPYNMWRIVDMGDSLYAIQNRANGLYLGRRQDLTNGDNNWVTMSKEPMKVQIVLLGRGQYEILPADSTCGFYSVQADKVDASGKYPKPVYEIGLPLHQQGNNFHMVWWGTGTERGYNTGSAYTFKELDADVDETMLSVPAKTDDIQIMSLPYDANMGNLGGFFLGDDMATAYTLNNLTVNADSTTTIELTEMQIDDNLVIKAGTPFILAAGEPEAGLSGDSVSLLMDFSEVTEYSQKSLDVNGLQASLCGDSIKASGFGYFSNNTLMTTDGEKTAYIKGHSGYINPKNVVNLAGSADLTVNTNGVLDAIKQAVIADRKKAVNVYTTDGVLIKKGVAEGDAKNGLKKGNYIIGKYKVNINK